jgi:hypothetical protein
VPSIFLSIMLTIAGMAASAAVERVPTGSSKDSHVYQIIDDHRSCPHRDYTGSECCSAAHCVGQALTATDRFLALELGTEHVSQGSAALISVACCGLDRPPKA